MEDRRSPRWRSGSKSAPRLWKSCNKGARERYQAREDVRLKREAWHKMQPMLDPARLVFIDETGLDTVRVRRYGWGGRLRTAGSRFVPTGALAHEPIRGGFTSAGPDGPEVIKGPDGGCLVQGLCAGIPLSNALAGRHRGLGQPVFASGGGCSRGD
jgi:hypothetical protein